MNILICNVGSTSLKYQLFRMPAELSASARAMVVFTPKRIKTVHLSRKAPPSQRSARPLRAC